MMNKPALTLIMLLFPMAILADEIKKDTVATQQQMIIVERDTVFSMSDTVFSGNYAIKITTTTVKEKLFDTIYPNQEFLANAEQIEIADNEDIDSDSDELDIGGDEDEYFFDEGINVKLFDGNISYEIPAADIYSVWVNSKVNPYNINIATIKDSVQFDMSEFVYPLVQPLHVTSRFGIRRGRYHNGIDLKLYTGDSVVAPLRGMVRVTGDAGRRRGYGKYVIIRHYNGLETVYGHLSAINVENNQVVEAGDLIGLGGNTGRSYGSHLHWEFRYLGNPINPEEIIDFENYKSISDVYCLVNKKTFNHIIEQGQAKYWTVKKGDTLSRITSRTGVSVKKLCSLNKITAKTILRVGQKIRYN